MINICVHHSTYAPALDRLRAMPDVHVTLLPPAESDPWQLPAAQAGEIEILFSSTAPANLDAAGRLRLL